jgi:hypothetical protein
MKRSKKIISIAAFALTALAALTMTGCSVVDGAIRGIFGSPLTKAAVASAEYFQDLSQALTVEVVETSEEDGTTVSSTTTKYVFAKTAMEYSKVEKNGEVTTRSLHDYLYYKQVDGDYAAYVVREESSGSGVWYETADNTEYVDITYFEGGYSTLTHTSEAAFILYTGRIWSAQSFQIDIATIFDYAKKIDANTYTIGPDEILKSVEDAKSKGGDLEWAGAEMLGIDLSGTIVLADGKLSEMRSESSQYRFDYQKTKHVKCTEKSTTKITYGGEVTLPVITPPAA